MVINLDLLECEPGRYGKNCTSECGYCANKEPCNHRDGTCLIGCDVGYVYPLCKEGKFVVE